MSTDRQINANRQNANLSTGPRSVEGKAVSSANALRHGLFASRPVAIPSGLFAEADEDVSAFVDALHAALAPRDAIEREQALRISTYYLRCRRLARYEAIALGDDGEPAPANDYRDGNSDGDFARGMIATITRVAAIDARTSHALERALVLYTAMQQRPLASTAPDTDLVLEM